MGVSGEGPRRAQQGSDEGAPLSSPQPSPPAHAHAHLRFQSGFGCAPEVQQVFESTTHGSNHQDLAQFPLNKTQFGVFFKRTMLLNLYSLSSNRAFSSKARFSGVSDFSALV